MAIDENAFSLFNTKNTNGRTSPLTLNIGNADAHFDVFCKSFAHARCIDDMSKRVHKAVQKLGFTDYLFIRINRTWQTGSKNGLMYSLPEELMRVYQEEHLSMTDLLIRYAKTNHQPIFSSQIYDYIDNAPFDIDLTVHNRRLLQLYKRYGYYELAAIPIEAYNNSGNVLLILTSTANEKNELQSVVNPIMPICHALCKAIDSVSTKKFKSTFIDESDSKINITKKSLESLTKLAQFDMSITDLASVMCISPITAHQHIAAARKAFKAKTNIGAVIKAVKAGLINIS